jgi:hypothetical protein
MSKNTETKVPEIKEMDRALAQNTPYKKNVTLIDFMAGIAFLGYAINKFEDIYVPEGSTLGEEVGRESYAWARAMFDARLNDQFK